MPNRLGDTNKAAIANSRSLLAQAAKAEAISRHDLPSVRGILGKANEISGLDLTIGWATRYVGELGLTEYLRSQGIFSAVIVDGAVHSDYLGETGPVPVQTDPELGDLAAAQTESGLHGLSTAQLSHLLLQISTELDTRFETQ